MADKQKLLELQDYATKGNVEALEALEALDPEKLEIINMTLSYDKASLLHISVLYDQENFTEKLLQMGANVNPMDGHDRTPLDYSLEGWPRRRLKMTEEENQKKKELRERIIDFLLEYGGTRGAGPHRVQPDEKDLLEHMEKTKVRLYEEHKLEDTQKDYYLPK
jgi:hypothetical protein